MPVGGGARAVANVRLVAAWTETPLAAGEGDEHLVAAVPAADSSEAEVQVAATEKSAGNLADDRPPRAVTPGVTPAVGALELREVTLDGSIEGGLPWPPRAIDRCDVWRHTDHGTAAFRCGAGGEGNDVYGRI